MNTQIPIKVVLRDPKSESRQKLANRQSGAVIMISLATHDGLPQELQSPTKLEPEGLEHVLNTLHCMTNDTQANAVIFVIVADRLVASSLKADKHKGGVMIQRLLLLTRLV